MSILIHRHGSRLLKQVGLRRFWSGLMQRDASPCARSAYMCLGSKLSCRNKKYCVQFDWFSCFCVLFFFHFTSFWPNEFVYEHFALSLPMPSYQEGSQNFTLVIMPTPLVFGMQWANQERLKNKVHLYSYEWAVLGYMGLELTDD